MVDDSYLLFDYPETHFLTHMSSSYLPTADQFLATLTPSPTTAFMCDPHNVQDSV